MAEVRRQSEKAIQSCKYLPEWQASGRGMPSFPPSCHPQEDRLLDKDTTGREGQGALRQTILCDYDNKRRRRHKSSRGESELALPCYIVSTSATPACMLLFPQGSTGCCGELCHCPVARLKAQHQPFPGGPSASGVGISRESEKRQPQAPRRPAQPSSGCVNKPVGGSLFTAEWQLLGSGSSPSFRFQRNVSCSSSQGLIQFCLSL